MCPRFDSWWHHTAQEELLSRVAPLIVFAISQQAEQSTGIIYKMALCPRFDSWWHHTAQEELLSRVAPLIVFAISQQAEQSTGIIYKMALCPRFDSWWHHTAQEELLSRVAPLIVFAISQPMRCVAHRSALHRSSQRAAKLYAACCIFSWALLPWGCLFARLLPSGC